MSFNAFANQPLPSPLLNSAMDADEGCASVSDDKGQILFYTNGVTVYNRLNSVMLNGDGLAGNISSFQSCLIVPVPGNDSIYYIFTTDAMENNFSNGYRYSIVNMNGDNGKGEVIAKNVMLWASSTERMCAARHANGMDVWLITNDNNSNVFRAWLITCSGLQAAPIVSTVGMVMDQHPFMNTGSMKVSPDGTQLCQTHFPQYDPVNFIPNFFQLFDFDNTTGSLSNARSISFLDAQEISCEYSPDSKLLYLTRPKENAVDQVECTLATPAAIMISRITINTGASTFYGIQMGPDEKIYLTATLSKYLGVINQPNVKGAGCNFKENQVDLKNKIAYNGLPSIINDLSYDPFNGFTHSIVDSCSGTVQFNGFSGMAGTLQWHWEFGDGTTADIQNPVHTFNPPNQPFNVLLKITSSTGCGDGTIYRSKIIKPQGIISQVDFDFISDCKTDDVIFINKTPFSEDSAGLFTWDFGDGTISNEINPVHTYTFKDTFTVKLKMKTSTFCLDDSISHDITLMLFQVKASPYQTIFVGQTAKLDVAPGGQTYQWTPTIWLNNPNIKSPSAQPLDDITYKVTVTNKDGCISQDSIFIKVLQL
ncbi:MAG: PKD domain-containing protein, partial [Bacteroidia bacterium]|nr:PKD domain-containing protein [Bacteroidia bacterium]